MNIPIIIFHIGNQEYVHLCLKQAIKYGNKVHILTDNKDNFNYNNVVSVNYSNYSNNLKKFEKIYQHFSTNSYQLELICIIRWMCIYEYMKEKNIEKAFICDSDVLLYDNISNIIDNYFKDNLYLSSSSSKNTSGHCCIFTLNIMESFIKFCFDFYNTQIPNILKWKDSYKEPGGICDMTLLYYFCNNQTNFVGLRLPDYPYFENDLTKVINNDFTFDLHLGSYGNHNYPEEYEINETLKNKNIKFINNIPYCYNTRLKKDIRFVLLHFQGRNKRIMKDYYSINNII